jgi:hypothetical protein
MGLTTSWWWKKQLARVRLASSKDIYTAIRFTPLMPRKNMLLAASEGGIIY